MSSGETPLRNLESLPKTSDLHTLADYVELLCLVNLSQSISVADVLDRLRERKDVGEEVREPDDLEELSMPIELDIETMDEQETSLQAINNDKSRQKVMDWFAHLACRQEQFGEFYPFVLDANGTMLICISPITEQHKLYVFLLLSANLGNIEKSSGRRNTLTSDFETLSAEALRGYLPEHAEVHVFGKGTHAEQRYVGNLWKKINTLATDLRERVNIDETSFTSSNSGDKGLDIVAWVPPGDDLSGRFIYFGQCACTPDWVMKQHTAGASAWRPVMTFMSPPVKVVFIPYCFRRANGAWYKPQDIHESIVIDRLRLLKLLRVRNKNPMLPSISAIVDKALEQRESVF